MRSIAELEHLYLVELVTADHATLVGTVRACLTAEAGGVGEELLGQVCLRKDLVTALLPIVIPVRQNKPFNLAVLITLSALEKDI